MGTPAVQQDVGGMTLAEIRALRRACAASTPGHRPYPNTCPNCHLGVAFVPHEGPQEEFTSSDVRELLYGGQAGGGKSAGLVAIPLRWADHPRFNGLILRRDTTQLKRLLKEADALYPVAFEGARRTMKGDAALWRFPSGAEIRFEHCQHETDVKRYDGDEFQYVGYDELTHFTKNQFTGINARIRGSVPSLPRYSRGTSNPGGEGHEWVLERWGAWLNPEAKILGLATRRDPETGAKLPPARPGEVLWFHPETDERVPKGTPLSISRTFIPAKLEDNPSLAVNDPEYRSNLMALNAVRRAQLLRGDWLAKAGRGVYFQRGWFKTTPVAPTDIVARVRIWDLAATEEAPTSTGKKKKKSDPDWTVGELWSKTQDGRFILEDIVRFRGRPHEVDAAILTTAHADGKHVKIRIPQDPGQAGKAQKAHFVRMLAGFTVRCIPVTGDKVTRAGPFSSQVEGGNVYVVIAPWNAKFYEELEAFPEGEHDDQVDAGSDAIAELAGDLPWSDDLDRFPGSTPRDMREGDQSTGAQGQWSKPSSHATDADKPKRGRW